MEARKTVSSQFYLDKGIAELARHRPDAALAPLRRAVNATPASRAGQLCDALYWLSVALIRLGERDLAVKSLASAQKLRRRGFARRAYLRTANGYGMQRRANPRIDDFYAFMNVQMSAYLGKKAGNRFGSFQEREAVFRLLVEAWKRLADMSLLDGKDCAQKLVLFRRVRPSLPSFGFACGLSSAESATGGAVGHAASGAPFGLLRGDFSGGTGRCLCGSGLPYVQCCGRVKSLREL